MVKWVASIRSIINDLDSPNSTQTSLPGVRLEALITPISTGLRERLIKEGVIENSEKTENDEKELKLDRINSKSQPAKTREDYEDILDIDDNQSWDALRAKGIIDFKTRVSLSDRPVRNCSICTSSFIVECRYVTIPNSALTRLFTKNIINTHVYMYRLFFSE